MVMIELLRSQFENEASFAASLFLFLAVVFFSIVADPDLVYNWLLVIFS